MNAEIKTEIDSITLSIQAKGWRMSKPSGKALRRIAELGLTDYLGIYARADVKGDAIVKAVIEAAEQAGGAKVTVGGWTAGGDGDVVTTTTKPSTLYTLLNTKTYSNGWMVWGRS